MTPRSRPVPAARPLTCSSVSMRGVFRMEAPLSCLCANRLSRLRTCTVGKVHEIPSSMVGKRNCRTCDAGRPVYGHSASLGRCVRSRKATCCPAVRAEPVRNNTTTREGRPALWQRTPLTLRPLGSPVDYFAYLAKASLYSLAQSSVKTFFTASQSPCPWA